MKARKFQVGVRIYQPRQDKGGAPVYHFCIEVGRAAGPGLYAGDPARNRDMDRGIRQEQVRLRQYVLSSMNSSDHNSAGINRVKSDSGKRKGPSEFANETGAPANWMICRWQVLTPPLEGLYCGYLD